MITTNKAETKPTTETKLSKKLARHGQNRAAQVQAIREAVAAMDARDLETVLPAVARRVIRDRHAFPGSPTTAVAALALLAGDLDMLLADGYSDGLPARVNGLKHAVRDGYPFEEQMAAWQATAEHVSRVKRAWGAFKIYLDDLIGREAK